MPEKEGFWSWAKTMPGAMILTGVLTLFAVGVFKASDLRKDGEHKVVSEKEALNLYIDRAATLAAEKAVSQNDRYWKEWRDATERRIETLERYRWASRNGAAPQP